LGSELERWSQSIIDLGEYLKVIIGDVLIACSFVSFVGPFNKKFRDMIIYDNFVLFCKENKIPMGKNPNPIALLCDEAEIAGWNTYGLPPDIV
jgi:dynein heavy chain